MVQPFCKTLAVLTKLNKHLPYDRAIDPTPRCLPKRNKNICSRKDFYTGAHRNFTLCSQKLATTQMPLRRRVGKCTSARPFPSYCPAVKRHNLPMLMSLKHHVECKQPATKGHRLCESIPEKANLQPQKVNEWLPRLEDKQVENYL